MTADFVCNGAVSGPIYLPGVEPDVDLNGVKFSYAIGLFYTPNSKPLPFQLPPPFAESP